MKMRKGKSFGRILALDLYDCESGACDDAKLCEKFLEELVELIGMHKQSGAEVVRTDHQKYPDKKGLSGWIPLVESGIQLHTLSVKDYISVIVYSCNEFSKDKVVRFAKKFFKPKKVKIPERIEDGFLLIGEDYHT